MNGGTRTYAQPQEDASRPDELLGNQFADLSLPPCANHYLSTAANLPAAAKAHLYPPQPEFNNLVSYDSKWLMDDGVVLEPLVGNRVYHSLACLDRTMVAVWGKEGVNVEKMAEEGEPAGTQL